MARKAVRGLIFLVAFSGLLLAQRDMGSISGIVGDSSGAPVPNAKVTIREIDKGTVFTTETNNQGAYVATPLQVGRYEVDVQKQGFKTLSVGPIVLQVQQRAAADVTLQVGELSQRVEVSGATAALQTEAASLGQVINSQEMVNLPLNGRNFAQLALLSAGVTPSEPGSRNQTTYGFAANGGRSLQNNFLLDGIDNNSNLPDLFNSTSYAIQPSVEALQEFKVQTNAYSAEFGRGNGAVINATIKSGTNQLHGDAYEFIRNNAFDARNFFESTIPHYSQNQFGTTLGGPVVIPKLYNGRDRTFFFADYEGLWISQGQDYTATVPTLAQRQGNFQNLIGYSQPTGVNDCNGVPTYQGEIFNTRLTQRSASSPTGLCGVPFGYGASGLPVNQIPAGVMDSLAARLAALYPLPNATNPAFNYFVTPNLREHQNNFDIRVDHRFSDKDSSFYRFSYENQPSVIPPLYPGFGDGGGFFSGDQVNAYKSFTLSETHIFTPNVVNEFRFGYDRINSHRLSPNSNIDVSGQLGFPGVPYQPGLGGLPFMTFSDVSQLGSAAYLPSIEKQNVYNYLDSLTWFHGKHLIKIGTEIRAEEVTFFQPPFSRGTLDFSSQFTNNPAAPGTGGSGLASFLLGVSDSATITNAKNVDMLRHVPAVYVQDDFRVSQKLTLNLGLRWEYYPPPVDKFNAQGNFDLATQTMIVPRGSTVQLSPILSALIPLSATGSRGLVNPDYRNWAPRVGFAYKPLNRVVVRGGYGIFYGGEENGPYSIPLGYNPPFLNTQAYATQCSAASANPALGAQNCALPGLSVLANGFPSNALANPNTPSLTSYSQFLPTPYLQQWNLATQYQLPLSTFMTLAYAGSKGTHLYAFPNANQATPTADPNIPFDVRRPYPNFDNGISQLQSATNSNFNALELTVERQLATGFAFLGTYTWSHALCEGQASAGIGGNNNSSFRYARNLELDYGNCDFNTPQRAVFSYTYQLPFGRGKQWGGGVRPVVDAFLGQWQINGITTFSEGQNFTVTDSNGNFSNSDGSQHPDALKDPNTKPCVPGTVFDTCAFTDPPLGSFGNSGMNTVRGPGFQNWDFSIFKNFGLNERTHLQFRAEFFNIFNHPNPLLVAAGAQFSIFSTAYGQPQLGYPTAAMSPRQIQFALKLYY